MYAYLACRLAKLCYKAIIKDSTCTTFEKTLKTDGP